MSTASQGAAAEKPPVIDGEPAEVGQAETRSQSQNIGLGDMACRFFNRCGLMTVLACAGGLMISRSGSAAESQAADNPVPALTAPPHPEISHASPFSITSNVKCTRIQTQPRGLYIGKACSNNSYLIKEHNSYSRRQNYGIVVVNGIYKCGWVVAGVIRTIRPKHKPHDCRQAFSSLHDPYSVFSRTNGPGHTDGAPAEDLTGECDDKRLFANFATKFKSIFNLHPDDNSGLSGVVGEQQGQVHFRGITRQGSVDGKAALVRGNVLHWGFMPEYCPQITTGGPEH